MNFLDFWCGKDKDGFCPAIDQNSGILYFGDTNHPTPLGAVRQAEFMLKEYELFVGNEKKWIKGFLISDN